MGSGKGNSLRTRALHKIHLLRGTANRAAFRDSQVSPASVNTDRTYQPNVEMLSGLDASQQHAIQHLWELCGQLEPSVATERKAETRAMLLSRIAQEKHVPKVADRSALRLLRRTSVVRTAAYRTVSLTAALVIAVALIVFSGGERYRVVPGSEANLIHLDDGTSVLLSPGSRLTVGNSFGKDDRAVRLRGEAFFNVAKGPLPFSVKTADATTTVLGTSFNVRSWPGSLSDMTHIVVETGRVSVAVDDLHAIVEPGQALTVSPKALTPVETDPQERLAWRSGGFSYDNELIGTILEDVERRFGISVKAPASIRLRPVTIHRKEVSDASEFIGDIAATISVRYRTTANGLEMYLD